MRLASLTTVLRTRAWLFLALGILTLGIRAALSCFPQVVERVYSRGIFVGIRYLLDYTVGWSPIPFAYLLVLALLVGWGVKWRRQRRRPRRGLKARFKAAALNLGGFLGAATFFFYFLWGFNYHRIPIEDHLGLELDSLDVETLCQEAEWAARKAEQDRAAIPGIGSDSIPASLLPHDLETKVRTCVRLALTRMGYTMHGRIRGRVIAPGGWMLRIGISGIYNPYTGEGNVTGAQTPQKIPFTMAHEMAHACGFGDEGTCNFVGMVACGLSDDPFVRYSGHMAYWGHVANSITQADPQMAKMLTFTLAPGIKADLRADYNNYLKYHGAISRVGNQVNHVYLKAQGVKEGIKSYDRVVALRAAWHHQTGE